MHPPAFLSLPNHVIAGKATQSSAGTISAMLHRDARADGWMRCVLDRMVA
jgi:hypothetical protein